jgi:AcrR family transcriptional regulator
LFTEMKRAKRRYEQRVRGARVAETRARIVEAIMSLHGEVGPRNTTVSAIANRAGVERLTVYRHFKDEAEMFAACSGRYMELHPPPDPTAWARERDPNRRVRRGLADLYAFFSRTAPMFAKVYLDVDESPALRTIMAQFDAQLGHLADELTSAWPRDKSTRKRQTILRHAAKFATWQSFEAEGVNNEEKIELIIGWLPS